MLCQVRMACSLAGLLAFLLSCCLPVASWNSNFWVGGNQIAEPLCENNKLSSLPSQPTTLPFAEMAFVVDVFLFNGEPVVVPRLALLYPYVDLFVVVESRESFSGNTPPKEEYFVDTHRDWFGPYLDKVRFLKLDRLPRTGDAWAREAFQRDAPLAKLLASPFRPESTVVLCCDSDEIPSTETLEFVRSPHSLEALRQPHSIAMRMFYYNLNRMFRKEWTRPFAVRLDGLRGVSAHSVRQRDERPFRCPGVGWHVSFALSVADIQRKLASFSHTEFSGPDFRSVEHIAECIREGRDLFRRPTEALEWFDAWAPSVPKPLRDFHQHILDLQQPFASVPETPLPTTAITGWDIPEE